MQSGLRAAFAWLCVAAAPVAAADLDTAAADPGWAALLHVSDSQPMVRDPAFLLSLPQFSLRAELQATVALLQGPDAQSLCRFPARYLWLHRQGVLTKLRHSAGQDVEGGCGQLRAREAAGRPVRVPVVAARPD